MVKRLRVMRIGRNELRPYMMFDRFPDYFGDLHNRDVVSPGDRALRPSMLRIAMQKSCARPRNIGHLTGRFVIVYAYCRIDHSDVVSNGIQSSTGENIRLENNEHHTQQSPRFLE
jgi:hypothetical protein